MSSLTLIAAYTTPAATVVLGSRWVVGILWTRFNKKLDEGRDLNLTLHKQRSLEITEVKIALGKYQREIGVTLNELKVGFDSHGQRIAHLEGLQGQPLGSTPRKL